nr:hypothetical protein [Pseudodesulfovibrio sp. JC047]
MAAGILNAIPMALLNTEWEPIVAIILHWLGLAVLLSYARFPLNHWAAGMLFGGLTALPLAVLMHSGIPIIFLQDIVFALILGGFLGYSTDKFINTPH